MSSRTIWLSVWDWDRFGRNQFLGEIHLPLSSFDFSNATDRWYFLEDKVKAGVVLQCVYQLLSFVIDPDFQMLLRLFSFVYRQDNLLR